MGKPTIGVGTSPGDGTGDPARTAFTKTNEGLTHGIHDDVVGEIAAITEKATPVDADLLLIEDSAASNAKKKAQIANVRGLNQSEVDARVPIVSDALYRPAMMRYDGATGFYNATYTSSGNKVTVVVTFGRIVFSGDSTEAMLRAEDSSGRLRVAIYCYSSSYSNADRRDKLTVQTQNSAGTNICRLVTASGYLDGDVHTLFYEFDGDAGTAELRIDQDDADDAGNADRIAPTTGTLGSGASSVLRFGSDGTFFFGGRIGYSGMKDVGGLDYNDFIDGSRPKQINEVSFSAWNGQPLFFNPHGQHNVNLGSVGAMTANGTIRAWLDIFGGSAGLEL